MSCQRFVIISMVCWLIIWGLIILTHPSNIQTYFILSEQNVYIKNFMWRFWQENTKSDMADVVQNINSTIYVKRNKVWYFIPRLGPIHENIIIWFVLYHLIQKQCTEYSST